MTHVFGVDAGGSKTHALVLNSQGYVLGFGSSGCGNHQVRGLASAVTEIQEAVKTAIHQAALSPEEMEVGYYCLAGADLPKDYQMLTKAMQKLGLAREVVVKNDTMAALRASITRSWGVAVICGSGFNAAARSPRGEEVVLPGLGFISGDWGGGSQLSHEMIRLVMRAWDGRGEKTILTGLVLQHFSLSSEDVLLEQLYSEAISHHDLIKLVPLLFEAAEADDLPAKKLIIQLAEEVAVTANALIRRLALEQTDVEVGLAGGVFKGKGSLLVETITNNIHQVAPAAQILKTRYEPVVGAALLALENANISVDTSLYRNLNESLPENLKYRESWKRVGDLNY